VKPLRVDAAARAELIYESQYLERSRPGYGKNFVAEIKSIFAQIKRNPEAGKPDEERCRRLRVTGFSFSVVFREESSEVVVYAIRPDQRQPGYWNPRAR